MKKILLLSLVIFAGLGRAQSFSPIATTGYNLDAIAENTTAVLTTGGGVDGGGHVMYSFTYGQIYNPNCTGLPNSGLLVNGQRTYQLQPYTQNNTLYMTALQTNTLNLVTPAPYFIVSLAVFSTDGSATMNVTLKFTDGTTQSFNNLPVLDWYTAATNTIVNGYDRATRSTGTPDYTTVNPNFYYTDLNLSCANRVKNLQNIIVNNLSSSAKICVMAASGSNQSATYSVTTSPVTCSGGNNGTATVSVSNGVPTFSYTWGTNPVINTGVVNSISLLPVGVTNYTVTDGASCTYTSFVTIGQSIVAQPPLVVTASSGTVCSASTVTLNTSGASTYTWNNGNSSSTTTVLATVQSSVFSVVATTSANCTLNGSYSVTVIPPPAITFTSIPDKLCLNAGGIPLSASPAGGSYSGAGVSFNSFFPNLAGVGTQTISYSYTDQNGCNAVNTVTTVVSTPTTVIAFTITPSSVCVSSPSITLNATPAGGTFTGTGVSGSAFTPSVAGISTKTVTYTYTDANNCTASKKSVITVTACITDTGIGELSTLNCLLYPNPNQGSFTIQTNSDMTLTLVNGIGQHLQTISLDQNNSHQVYLENLPVGIYFLKSDKGRVNQKIVVTKN